MIAVLWSSPALISTTSSWPFFMVLGILSWPFELLPQPITVPLWFKARWCAPPVIIELMLLVSSVARSAVSSPQLVMMLTYSASVRGWACIFVRVVRCAGLINPCVCRVTTVLWALIGTAGIILILLNNNKLMMLISINDGRWRIIILSLLR